MKQDRIYQEKVSALVKLSTGLSAEIAAIFSYFSGNISLSLVLAILGIFCICLHFCSFNLEFFKKNIIHQYVLIIIVFLLSLRFNGSNGPFAFSYFGVLAFGFLTLEKKSLRQATIFCIATQFLSEIVLFSSLQELEKVPEKSIFFLLTSMAVAVSLYYETLRMENLILNEFEKSLELDKLNSALISTQSKLIHQAKIESLGMITASIIHDIATPMHIILQSIGDLEDENPAFSSLTPLKTIKLSSANMLRKLESIRRFTRNTDSLNEREKISVADAVEEFKIVFGSYLAQNQVNLIVDLDLDVEYCFDRIILDGLFQNTLKNSCEAFITNKVEHDRYLKISVNKNNNMSDIRIIIEDNAGGIPKQYLDKIFNPFFTTKPKEKGTGLGLSQLANLIRHHSGTIDVSSFESMTQFIITLPFKT